MCRPLALGIAALCLIIALAAGPQPAAAATDALEPGRACMTKAEALEHLTAARWAYRFTWVKKPTVAFVVGQANGLPEGLIVIEVQGWMAPSEQVLRLLLVDAESCTFTGDVPMPQAALFFYIGNRFERAE